MTLTPSHHAHHREYEDTLVVIDVDRTLFETNLFSEAVFTILDRQGMKEDARVLGEIVEHNTGNTFDLMREVEKLGMYPSADDLVVAVNGRPFLYVGVDELLNVLGKSGIATMILTYGGLSGQRLKLEIISRELESKGLSLPPSIITQESRKAEWIDTAWERAENGRFIVPEGVPGLSGRSFSRIVILDDKTSNLETSNDGIEGVKIDNGGQGDGVLIGEAADKILTKLAHR